MDRSEHDTVVGRDHLLHGATGDLQRGFVRELLDELFDGKFIDVLHGEGLDDRRGLLF